MAENLTAQIGLISADDHMDMCYVPADLWQSRVPAKWKEAAPKVIALASGQPMWVKENQNWGIWGKKTDGRMVPFPALGLEEEPEPGVFRCSTPAYRLEDMDRDGVYAQVIYNFTNWYFVDQELKAVCVSAFNEWIAEFCSADPNRLIGLGVLPAHDPAAAVGELERATALGLRSVMFDVFGVTVPIDDPAWDVLWSAAEASSTPISFHIGRSTPGDVAGSEVPQTLIGWRRPASAAVTGLSLHRTLVDVTMSGILERHPELQLVFGESSIGWIPFILERLDYECENYKHHTTGLPSMKPSELFRRNVYCTFQNDNVGVTLIPTIGEDNVMWAADYAHGDGTFPYSVKVTDEIFAASSPSIKQKATRDNARKLYRIE